MPFDLLALSGLSVLLGLLALILLLLAIPIDVNFRVRRIGAFNGNIAIRWLFGLVRFDIRLPDDTNRPARPESEAPAAKVRVKHGRGSARLNVLALLRQAEFRRRLARFAKDLVRAGHLRQLQLQMRLGLGDPADTGCLWALIGPLNAAAHNLRNAQVHIEPEFIDPVFEFQTSGRLLIVPLQLLILTIGLALSPSTMRAWRALNGSRD